MTQPPLDVAPDVHFSIQDAVDVAVHRRQLAIDDTTFERLERSQSLMAQLRDQGDLVYGLTTGFGPLAAENIDPAKARTLQQNLIYHLCSGTGEPMEEPWVRAMLFCRVVSLCRGHSALRRQTLERVVAIINAGVTPRVPRYGTVGASGDLTPLAHAVLAMMGEADMLDGDSWRNGESLLKELQLAPLELSDRDGLALVNGTAAMTGIALLANARARRLLGWALGLSALFAECMEARREAFDPRLAKLRGQQGQQRITDRLHRWLADSRRLHGVSSPRSDADDYPLGPLLQDPYSIRCIPQMLGSIDDALEYHATIVGRELNGINDNPTLVFGEDGGALHGGNFFGHPVALSSDHLNQALISAAILVERQIAGITDASRSPFPAFLQPHQPGLQSGVMGAQVTASSLIAQLRSLSTPLSIQSIPTNAGNQDINPMGTLAALRSQEILTHLSKILAILAICTVQAKSLCSPDEQAAFASRSQALDEQLRNYFSPMSEDRPLSRDIDVIAEFLLETAPPLLTGDGTPST